ncbi:MAG: dephospho-CoA kinase, partial [Candidatus Aminicenantes bacterium]
MLIVALTGGIASGKSVIADVLAELGCYIHHADLVARELMEPEKPAWESVVAHFGTKILNSDRTINRSVLGEIVFTDEKERLFLNSVIH